MDAALLSKYNQSVPRYTSYPTALEFNTIDDQESCEAILSDSQNATGPLSLYFHLPFCRSLCWFCACTKIISTDQSIADRYLDYLEMEMDLIIPHLARDRAAVQLHFGGGTPNFLSPKQIARLGRMIHSRFDFAEDAELSIEIDPRTLTEEKVEAFVAMGVNRASIGVQDLDDDVQKAIHRIQSSEMNRMAIKWLRSAGIQSLNVDLIYGLPLQTVESFRRTLDEVLEYGPDRLAIFSYAHVPWSKAAQKIIERSSIPDAALKIQLLELIVETLAERGYIHIGMDHFTLPNDSLAIAQQADTLQRNFQGYSLYADTEICAFGISSISQTGRTYRQNVKTIEEYYDRLDAGKYPIERGCLLVREDQIRREVIMRLMCDMRLDYKRIGEAFDIDFMHHFGPELLKLKSLERDGLIDMHKDGLSVSDRGRLLVRNIAAVFDAHIEANRNAYSKAV